MVTQFPKLGDSRIIMLNLHFFPRGVMIMIVELASLQQRILALETSRDSLADEMVTLRVENEVRLLTAMLLRVWN